MPLLTKVEAAIALGISVELLDSFVRKCPKPHGSRKLVATLVDGQQFFAEDELHAFNTYLSEPWPRPPSGGRPNIPKEILDDVRQESHMACAICGHMDNGEIAHIEDVATTLNNSPRNLILLCPNHHTKYDLGWFRPASNITPEVIKAAKLLKRHSRVRMLQAEADHAKRLKSAMVLLRSVEEKLKNVDEKSLTATVYITEVKNLLATVAELEKGSDTKVEEIRATASPEKKLPTKAPKSTVLAAPDVSKNSVKEVRSAIDNAVRVANVDLIDIDEVECPHCEGTGTKGLAGDFCAYCRGAQVVTQAKAEHYDRDDIDEVECPHCEGVGRKGLARDMCVFCHGSQVMSQAKADKYDPEEIDEVKCPHCEGSGRKGIADDLCSYCYGAQMITQAKADKYNHDKIDEVECPHCQGTGRKGIADDLCSYCYGAQMITQAKADKYDRSKIDEVECPHCAGSGKKGRFGEFCAYCHGAQSVSKARAKSYDENAPDEVECPRCEGTGRKGLTDESCALCKGSQVVTQSKKEAYLAKYRS